MPCELGKKYRDEITQMEGVATARYEYLYGCVRIQLEGAGVDGKPEECIFDEQRLVGIASASATSGGSRPTPRR